MEREIVKIGQDEAGDVLSLVALLVKKCSELPNNPEPERKSGYLTIKSRKDGRLLLQIQIGECPSDKHTLYRTCSMAKATRLLKNKDSLSSWQITNESKFENGGAVIAHDFSLSFSGLPELIDEAVVLVTALVFGWLSEKEAKEISGISGNSYFEELKDRVYA